MPFGRGSAWAPHQCSPLQLWLPCPGSAPWKNISATEKGSGGYTHAARRRSLTSDVPVGVRKSESSSTTTTSGTLPCGSTCKEQTYFTNCWRPNRYFMLIIVQASSVIDDDAGSSKRDLDIRSLFDKKSTRFPCFAADHAICIHILWRSLHITHLSSATLCAAAARTSEVDAQGLNTATNQRAMVMEDEINTYVLCAPMTAIDEKGSAGRRPSSDAIPQSSEYRSCETEKLCMRGTQYHRNFTNRQPMR